MTNYYLYPETPDFNPSSFLTGAKFTGNTYEIEGYKLYAFIGCLDEIDKPFWIAPVQTPGKPSSTVKFYQFQFQDEPPKFEKYGLKLKYEKPEIGAIIYLPPQQLILLSSKYNSISVKNGKWPEAYNAFHQFAAYAHLDVIPQLSRKYIRNQSLDELEHLFHKFYDVSSALPSSLNSLFIEIHNLLDFFCFSPPSIANHLPKIKEEDFYFFGSLQKSISAFHAKCFPNALIGNTCITPASVKQLRAMMRFVRISLSKIAKDPGNDIESAITMINKFQRENDLPEGKCNSETLRMMWRLMLSKSPDPITTLSQAKVSLNLELNHEDDTFGQIDGQNCSPAGQKIADGFSRVVSKLPSPSSTIAKAQEVVISAACNAAKEFQAVGNDVSALESKIKGVMEFANDVNEEASKASERAELSIRIVDGLEQMNKEISDKVVLVKKRLDKQLARTNLLTLLLIILVIIFVIQWLKRKNKIPILHGRKNI